MEIDQPEGEQSHVRAKHIKKRALKNKSLSISFNEKDLKDYVTGFHKRKKKRRREANLQIQEADRRKRIELRKKRKLDRDFVLYGGAPPDPEASQGETAEDQEDDEENEPVASFSGITTYESGDVQVTVTTSEISREEEDIPKVSLRVKPPADGGSDPKKQKVNVTVSKKKPVKKAGKKKPQKRTQSKRDKRKGKVQVKKR